MTTAPLCDRPLDAPLAWLSSGLPALALPAGNVTVEQFLKHVLHLAKALPEGAQVINLCGNRYLFLLGLCAAIVRGQTSLLPPNKRAKVQAMLAAEYPDTYLLHDGVAELAELPEYNVLQQPWLQQLGLETREEVAVPQIDLSFLALISFTSGSTGKSKPNLKTWHTLRASTQINSAHMLPSQQQTYFHLASVPGQHMWGLETSVLMALFADVCIVDSQPLFPADIVAEIEQLPRPRALIATPLHLRSLMALKAAPPVLDNVLCATAPLSQALAAQVEKRFSCTLREVYGCSEVGSMAVRETAQTEYWQPFNGLEFKPLADKVEVGAEHLPAAAVLDDRLEFAANGNFRLQGRETDQVKVAGKRGSLREVNQVLLEFPGVVDAIAFQPPEDRVVERLAALVVFAGQPDRQGLRKHLKSSLDSAFVPRPIVAVERLPREENGKLPRQQLLSYYAKLRSG